MRLQTPVGTAGLALCLCALACREPPAREGLLTDHLRRGHALFEEGKYARAHIAFDRAHGLAPSNEEAVLWRDLSAVAVAALAPEVITDENINELDYDVDVLAPRMPEQAALLATARGNLLARAAKADEAVAAYRKALDAKPGFVPALYCLAQVLAQTGKATEAESTLRAATQADPKHVPSRVLLARLLAERRQWDDALQVVRDAMTLGATAQLDTLFGEIAAAAGKAGDAQTAFQDALRLAPNDVAALRGLAELLLQQRRLEEAAPIVDRYLEVAPAAGEPSERIAQARQLARQLPHPKAGQLGEAAPAATPSAPKPAPH